MNFGKGDENIVIFIIQNWSDKYLPVGTFVYELSLKEHTTLVYYNFEMCP